MKTELQIGGVQLNAIKIFCLTVSFKSSLYCLTQHLLIANVPAALVRKHGRVEGHQGGSCDILSH